MGNYHVILPMKALTSFQSTSRALNRSCRPRLIMLMNMHVVVTQGEHLIMGQGLRALCERVSLHHAQTLAQLCQWQQRNLGALSGINLVEVAAIRDAAITLYEEVTSDENRAEEQEQMPLNALIGHVSTGKGKATGNAAAGVPNKNRHADSAEDGGVMDGIALNRNESIRRRRGPGAYHEPDAQGYLSAPTQTRTVLAHERGPGYEMAAASATAVESQESDAGNEWLQPREPATQSPAEHQARQLETCLGTAPHSNRGICK